MIPTKMQSDFDCVTYMQIRKSPRKYHFISKSTSLPQSRLEHIKLPKDSLGFAFGGNQLNLLDDRLLSAVTDFYQKISLVRVWWKFQNSALHKLIWIIDKDLVTLQE